MKLKNLVISISLSLLSSQLQANPSGAQVVNGQVSFSQPDANTLQITNSNGSIINWQNFSVNSGETTHFQQGSASSMVLNQVVGNNASEIYGTLSSNGQVFLINQHGILFGPGAVIDTAGFIASTLNLADADFLNGRFNFESNDSADILNQGYIRAGADGDIALIAPNIINEGVIEVEQGNIILAAGEKVSLTSLDNTGVVFEVQAADNTVTNLGHVTTDGGAVGVFAGSLKHSGVIEANALALDENGNVVLVATSDITIETAAVVSANGENGGRVLIQSETGTTLVSGDLSASGENGAGGVIDVLGVQVGLIDSATIDASGTQGGGEIHIGGNYQGKGPLQNATATFVGQDVVIDANATESGDGGEVIVWADGTARVHGTINATGGAGSGDGGFVETSGKIYLDVSGIQLDLGADNGVAGDWLLDPFSIQITSAADLSIGTAPDFSSTATGSNLNIATLLAQLDAGTSVTIDTGVAGGEAGDILLDAAVAVTGATPVSLTLDAANDIILSGNASITSTNSALSLVLTADSAKNDVSDNLGAIDISSSIINTNGGNVTLNAGSGISISDATTIQTGAGNVVMDTVTGNITLNAITTAASIQTTSGSISLQAQSPASNITLQIGSASALLQSTTGNINLTADEININGTISSSAVTTLKPFDTAVAIQLVTSDFILGGNLIIGTDELANIIGDLVIGSLVHTAVIDINSPVVFTGGSNLALLTSNNINFNQTGGTAIDVGSNTLNIQADKIADNSAALDLLAASIDIQTVNGIGIAFGGEIDTQTDSLIFNNTTTGSVAFNNSSATGLTVSGTNASADSGVSIQIDDNSPLTTLGNINGGVNGDISITNFGGNLTLTDGITISGGANATQHLLSASNLITFGIGSSIHNNSGTAEIAIDASDLNLDNGSVDAFNGKAWINPNSSFDIGLGDGTIVSAGMVLNNIELANISAAVLGVGNTITNIDIGTLIDLGVLGYDLFLSAGGSLTFQPISGIDASGGKLTLYSSTFDFTTNAPVIQGTGILEFINLLDGAPIELATTCGASALCVTQANLDSLTDGFSLIRFVVGSGSVGGLDINSAMTFVDSVEIDTSITSGDININGVMNLGTNNIAMNTGLGAINFNLAAATEITANGVDLVSATINQAVNSVSNITANTFSFYTNDGLGSVSLSQPFLLSVNEIVSGENLNPAFDIYIRNDRDLLVTFLKQGSGIGLPVTLEVNGNLTVGQIDGGDANNSVILDTTAATNGIGGAILDNGSGSPNVTRAYRVELYSESGVGSMTDWFEVANVNDTNSAGGGLYVSAESSGDIFVDNVAGTANFFDVQAVTTNAFGSVFIHNASQPMNLNSSITTVAGNITLESNAEINLMASLNSGNGNIDVSVLSGSGNINVGASSGLLSNSTVSLSNSVGDILFGSTSFVMAPAVNLSAFGTVDDTGANNVIGGGSAVTQLVVNAGTGISLLGVNNDADQVSLSTTSGNINYRDINGITLNAAYASADGTATGAASGDVNIYSGGAITDGNGAATDVVAINAYLEGVNGIGAGDALDLNVSTLLTFANITSGDVNFNSISTGNLDFYGYSDSTTGFTSVTHAGVLTVPSLSPFVSPLIDLSINAPQVNIDGTVTGNNVILLTDELVMSGTGSINATNDVGIEILTDGTPIYLSTTDNVSALDISATEISQITAARLSIGVVAQPGTGFNSGNITFLEAINTGTMDTRFITAGNIIFNQGAAVALTNASMTGAELNTLGAIVDQSAGVDVQATNLLLVANSGIGDGNAIETQIASLDISNNTTGNVTLVNTGALTLVAATQNAALGDFSLTNNASITVPTINMAGGDVVLNTTGGQLLSDGSNPAISNAASVALSSTTGIGSLPNPFVIDQLGTGGLSATVSASGNMYIDNTSTTAVDFILAGLTINSGTAFIDNLDAAVDTRINGPVTGNGVAAITSISDIQIDGNFNMSATGGVDLTVSGAGNSIFINSSQVRSASGNITLLANTDIRLLGTANIQTAAPGLVTLTATNGQLFSDTTATITGGANLDALAQSAILLTGANNISSFNASVAVGNINLNTTGNLALDLVSVSATNLINITAGGAITDGNVAANNISGQTVSLNAATGIGSASDPLETAVANYLQFNNSGTGDVVIDNSVTNSVLLAGTNAAGNVDISYAGIIQLQAVNAGGNLSLTSVNGTVEDSNDGGTPALNLTASNITLNALTHIGSGNPIEMQLSGTTGNITMANSSTVMGNFEIDHWANNSTDVARLTVTNLAANGTLFVGNQTGITEITSVSTNDYIEIKSDEIRLNGTMTNNDTAGATAIVFITDEFDLTSGTIDAGLGDFSFETLTDGRLITLGGVDAGNTSLDLIQSDISAISSARISIGLLDTVNVIGSGDITVVGGLDFGARDTKIESYGDVIFANGTGAGLSTTGLMQLNVDAGLVGEASTGTNITATSLELIANAGIGSLNAIRTMTSDLSMLNSLLNNINVENTGSLQLTDSAALTGSMSVSATGVLTLTPNAGLAGTTGAVASTGLTLTGTNGLNINGVVSAGNISLLSANGITIDDTVTTLGALVIDADTDGNNIGNLLFENTQGGNLTISSGSLDLNAGNITLQATQGAVYVSSSAGMNLSAANDLSILGGNLAGADAYLSAAGDMTVDVGNNVLINGGGAANTAASLFDVTGVNNNTLTMTVGGTLIMNGGTGDNSGAYITAGNHKMNIAGDVTLSGSVAANSGAFIKSMGGNIELVMTPGILTFVDGAGTNSLAQVRSNDGFGLLLIDYLNCVGCDAGLVYFASPVANTAANEIVGTQNDSVIGAGSSVSSTDALAQSLEQAAADGTSGDAANGTATEEEESAAAQEEAEQARVLVCK